VLQALTVAEKEAEQVRFGFTVTRKTGNAVVRNRIRRRLRDVVRHLVGNAVPGTDYVLIGRRAALTLPFDRLIADLESGLAALARTPKAGNRTGNARQP